MFCAGPIIFVLIASGIVVALFAFMRARYAARVRAAAAHADVRHGVPPLDERLDFEPAGGMPP